jgi:ubiquinone/menaquinone biosynthesis C-methylase UbiE
MSKETEKAFFDDAYDTKARKKVWHIYSITHNRLRSYEHHLFENVKGKRVLEYGCGIGSYSFALAARGANVVGIDISEVAIRTAAARAKGEGLSSAEYYVMDAEKMTFPDASFDLVCGIGILHHLDLDTAFAELARVMKPGAKAIFMEPLGHNPAINAFRMLTPKLRTADEHPLIRRDFRTINRHFSSVSNEFHHLCSFGAMPFIKTKAFFPMVRGLDQLDRALFKVVPPVGWLAWYSIIVMSEPRLHN